MKKQLCEKCNREITVNNYKKHTLGCTGKKTSVKEFEVENGYKCPHCSKIFKKHGIKGHIWKNHTEEGKSYVKPAWNKGLTTETSEKVKQYVETKRQNIKDGKTVIKGHPCSEEARQKLSNTIKKKIEEGTWHFSFSKTRTHEYNGIKLYGKWELQFAQWLDQNNINWRRPKEKFPYEYQEKTRYYTPDFYLIGTNEYIEIKGYETEKDRSKWRDFPLKLRVIKGKELYELGIITKEQFNGTK